MLNKQFNNQSPIFNLEINDRVKFILLTMAKWTRFLAILGFIIMGLVMLGFIVFSITSLGNNTNPENNSLAYKIGYIIGGGAVLLGLYFYPTYALLMYSAKLKKAISATNQQDFELAVNYLKNSFKYLGISIIIFIVLYGILITAAIYFGTNNMSFS